MRRDWRKGTPDRQEAARVNLTASDRYRVVPREAGANNRRPWLHNAHGFAPPFNGRAPSC
jgi:hypothetical protein